MKKIFIYIAVLFMLLPLTSCASIPAEEPVIKMFDCILAEDTQGLVNYADSFYYTVPTMPDVLKDALRENCTYSVGNITKEKKTEYVEVTIMSFSAVNTEKCAVDKLSVMTASTENADKKDLTEDIAKAYEEAIAENKDNKTTVKLTIPVRRSGKNKFCIIGEELSVQIMNAIYGQ
ncbi:MAG: hypothetical protein E7218_08535 [Anaerofustis stercorihominis]|nr:hypothetical protein [Anaerofustis stercorihominis]